VVAEGIEHPRQLTELREMGCGYGQGFLVARPMGAPGVESLIRTRSGEDGADAGPAPGAGRSGVDGGTSASVTKAGAA
jgi:predicted signal transduction protein with EAL and GGDEF domain